MSIENFRDADEIPDPPKWVLGLIIAAFVGLIACGLAVIK
jgi:hypothetical protein